MAEKDDLPTPRGSTPASLRGSQAATHQHTASAHEASARQGPKQAAADKSVPGQMVDDQPVPEIVAADQAAADQSAAHQAADHQCAANQAPNQAADDQSATDHAAAGYATVGQSAALSGWPNRTSTDSTRKGTANRLARTQNKAAASAEGTKGVAGRTAPAKTAPAKTAPAKTAPAKPALAKPASAQTAPAKTAAVTAAPAKTTSANTVSAKAAAATAATFRTATFRTASATASATAIPATTVSATAAATAPGCDGDTGAFALNTAQFSAMAPTLCQLSHSTAQLQDPAQTTTTRLAAADPASGAGMCWDEFRVSYLPQCTSDFYLSEGWDHDTDLHQEQIEMLEAFQQNVFQMVNHALFTAQQY